MPNLNYYEIATDYALWLEHIDPECSKSDFDAMSFEDRLNYVRECFDEEPL